MKSIHRFHLNLRITTRNPIILRHFNHNVAMDPLQFDQPQDLRPNDAEVIALQVSNSSNLSQLRQIFCHMIQTRFLESYPYSFHYNNIIRIFTRLGSPKEALLVYTCMLRSGIAPDKFTFPIVLKAATQNLDSTLSKQVNGTLIKCGLESDMYCESGLISFYSKAGEFENAYKVFVNSTDRKLGSWNAIIGGLSQAGKAQEAVHMFIEMMSKGLYPDDMTMVGVTSACGSLGDLSLALQLHKCVFLARTLEKSDVFMMNSLIDMYGKCGRMDLAYKVFSQMNERNVSSYTSVIVGYASHGHVSDALNCFRLMIDSNVKPNHITFVGVLSACVHGGMVEEGKQYFKMMSNVYGIEPTLAHYGCMADLLGRAGQLDKAQKMVDEMPMKPNVVIWGCLMGACEKFGHVKMGERAAKHLAELEPENDGVFVALSNIYANHGMWEEVERMREIMRARKLAKVPAYSLPERKLWII